VNSRLLAQTHFLEQPGAVPALRREIEAFATAEIRAAPQPLVEGIEQPDRIDAGLVCAAGAHRADQPPELGQHRVELVLQQCRRGRSAAEGTVAAIEHDDLVPILRKPMRDQRAGHTRADHRDIAVEITRNRCACGAPAITDQPPRLT